MLEKMNRLFPVLLVIASQGVWCEGEICDTPEGYEWCENGCCVATGHSGQAYSEHCCTLEQTASIIIFGVMFVMSVLGAVAFFYWYKKVAIRKRTVVPRTQGGATTTALTNPGLTNPALSNNYGGNFGNTFSNTADSSTPAVPPPPYPGTPQTAYPPGTTYPSKF